ncbi:type I DNA topoisomerase [Candidatus Saccharibacteria bacterium CG10_big_fil_rev_8_21_14_0_10_47_8]|nr:MAG: type I DNA topoisomerase [Candidatus Saccharibacteria bacterium CG10_big_fil_rev_8_21_14_0_10_47_8]
MAKNLVIVESPTKAKILTQYLDKDFEIKSSFGHIRDLPKKGGIGVDVAKNFEPTYEVSPDKTAIVKELKKAAKSKTVWLASDPDREGEAIAWHVSQILGLDPKRVKRIIFHEITKPAILEAVANPRTIDMKLVDAQQARRILDRLVGYELSPVLWKKVRAGLSAGRVQSVAVKLIVEREREIKAHAAESSFKISAVFEAGKGELPAELTDKLKTVETAEKFLGDIAKAKFTVASVEQKLGTRSPGAPFTTSTLQQEASRKLSYSVRQTMTLAQRLYEHGHITYMRTDSTNLSPVAIDAVQKYITSKYGEKYSQVKQYKTKNKSAQEAHEAIRPTHVDKESAGADAQQIKLYKLIWRRAVASQMAPAAVEKTEVLIDISGKKEQFLASGEVLTFDGFFKVYGGGKDDSILPVVTKGQSLNLNDLAGLQVFTKPAARYGEASLVKKLEELGIGRPSTYAPTISTIQTREYIEKKDLEGQPRDVIELSLKNGNVVRTTQSVTVGADRAKLVPTPLAEIVTDFLAKYFASIIDYDFTAKAEDEFDDIAEGKISWQNMLKQFYGHFHPLVEKSGDATRAETSQARKLGKDPKTGESVIARFGRYGPMLQLGETPDTKDKEAPKPKFAPLPEGVELSDVTLEQALPMFELPREVGKTTDGQVITANIGRFGPYVKVDKQFFSIKDHSPMTITEAQAKEVIANKEKAAKERVVAEFGKIQVLRGPYGPYVTDGKKNAKIPKDEDPTKLTEKACQKLLDEAPVNKGRGHRKFPAKQI